MVSIVKYGQNIDLSKIIAVNGKKSLTLDNLVLNNTIQIKIPAGVKYLSEIVEDDLKIEFKDEEGNILELILKNMSTLLAQNDGFTLVELTEILSDGKDNKVAITDLASASQASAAGPGEGNTNSDSSSTPDSLEDLLSTQNNINNAGIDNTGLPRLLEVATPAGENILSRNTAPVIDLISAQVTDEDNSITITYTSSDRDGDALIPSVSAINGTVTISGNVITYVPNANFNGTDSITLSVNDGSVITTQTFDVVVNPVNDAPTIESISTQTVDEDGNKTITFVANDIDGDVLTSSITSVTNGTATISGNIITYTPTADYNGPATIILNVDDLNGGVVSQTINVVVNPVNDAPVITTVTPTLTALSETDFLTLGTKDNAYKIVTEQEMFNLLGVTDADANDSLSLSLTTDSSTFNLNGAGPVNTATDGVLQLTAADIVGFGLPSSVNVGDFFIYSTTFDAMDDADSTEVQFEVKAYDGTEYSTPTTVSLTVSGSTDTSSGTGIDGYISNMTVLSDLDGDKVVSGSETNTLTDSAGNFTLSGGDLSGTVVGYGGTDISTNLAFEGIYKAPSGSTVLNPTTSLLVDLMNEGKTLLEAKTLIYNNLGVNSNVDLLSDPIASAVDSTNSTVIDNYIAFQALNVEINNTIGQLSAAIDGAGLSNERNASDVISQEIAKMLILNNIDLTDASDINTLITNVLTRLGNTLTSSVQSDISEIIVNTNTTIVNSITNSRSAESAFENLAAIQIAAEETENELESGVSNDDTSLALSNSTGNVFESRVDNADVGFLTQAQATGIAPIINNVHSISSNDELDFTYDGQLDDTVSDSNVGDTFTYDWNPSTATMTLSLTGLNNLDSILELNTEASLNALSAASAELKPVLIDFLTNGNIFALTSLSSSTIITSKALFTTLNTFNTVNGGLVDDILSLKDFIILNKDDLIAQSSLTNENIIFLNEVLSTSNIAALNNLMTSIETFITANPTFRTIAESVLADNIIDPVELITIDPIILAQVDALRLELLTIYNTNSSLINLLDIEDVISKLSEISTIDPVDGEITISTNINSVVAESMINVDENTGEYSISNPYFNTLPESTKVEISFDYNVEDSSTNYSNTAKASILITSDDVSDLDISLDEGTLSAADNQNINMIELLENISTNNEILDIDAIDLSNGSHILSNLTIEDFEEMVSDSPLNELSIMGENNDTIKLDLSIWSEGTLNEDNFVPYVANGSSSQALTLLIENNIIVEDI